MAINYDLNNTGPEVQARLDQVLQNEASISEETQHREGADDVLRHDLENYTDAVDMRLSGELNELGIRLNAESSRAQLKEAELQSQADSLSANKANKSEVATELNKKANAANVYTKSETYSRTEINNLVTTPDQQFVTVEATAGTTEVTDVLPVTGEANTVYRVGKWDGTQYDADTYSEYAWDGTQYVLLSAKNPSIDAVPFSGSTALAESGGIAEIIGYSTRGIFLDSNHLVNFVGNTITYTYNNLWDCLWIPLKDTYKTVTVYGATFTRYRFFSSFVISAANYLDGNTTGVVPEGAVVCMVSLNKASNPDGYGGIRVETADKIDTTPTQGSGNPIASGAVFDLQDDIMANSVKIEANSVKVGSLYPNGSYIDPNHVCSFSSDTVFGSYIYNAAWDAVWITPQYGTTKIKITGVTWGRIVYFSDLAPTSANYLGYNTDGTVIDGTKLVIVDLKKENNPDGYDDMLIKQDNALDVDEVNMKIWQASQEIVISKNHILNVRPSSQEILYQANSLWDCIFIPITDSSVTRIEVSGVTGGKYRFFDTMDLSGNLQTNQLASNSTGEVPDGSKICIINCSKADNPDGLDGVQLRKYSGCRVRLLAIGNSYSQDALAYVPFILQEMGLDVDIQIGILMMSSSTLSNHVSNFVNSAAAYTFYLYNGGTSWQNLGLKSIQDALDGYNWDLITLNQGANVDVDTWNRYQPNCNILLNYLSSYVTYPVKFVWYNSIARPATDNGRTNWSEAEMSDHYDNSIAASQRLMDEAIFEVEVPVGTAIQNARTILSLKNMGDYANNPNNTSGKGYLTCYDGVHLQEGLPCQIAAYSFILALLDVYGFDEHSIIGETTRVTADWAASKAIPGPHGDYIGSDDTNCLIAQKCAVMAHKHPYEVTDMNYIVNPS